MVKVVLSIQFFKCANLLVKVMRFVRLYPAAFISAIHTINLLRNQWFSIFIRTHRTEVNWGFGLAIKLVHLLNFFKNPDSVSRNIFVPC